MPGLVLISLVVRNAGDLYASARALWHAPRATRKPLRRAPASPTGDLAPFANHASGKETDPVSTRQANACQIALAQSQQGESNQAIATLQTHLATAPYDGAAWEMLGRIAYEAGRQPMAKSALETATMLVPLSARSQILLARCYEGSGQRELSARMYRHVAELPELDVEMLEPLAAGLGRCGEALAALNVCRLASLRMPSNPQPLMGIVHYLRRLRRPVNEILPAAYRACQLAPENAEIRITLAWMLHETGRSEEGAELLADVPCEDFSCIRCLSLMQHLFAEVGDVERATECRTRLMVLATELHEPDWNAPDFDE